MKFNKVLLVLTSFLLLNVNFVFGESSGTSMLSSMSDTEVEYRLLLALSSPDYPITAGDVYQLSYNTGTRSVVYPIVIDSSYMIKVSNLGVVDAHGKTFLEIKELIESIVSKNYPMSGVQFALRIPALFKVTLTGEVKEVKEIDAWAMTRLSTIFSYGTSYASSRDIEVISKDGTKKSYDLFEASRKGDMSQDPCLKPGDVVRFKKYDRKVVISGEVERPGTYELLKGENINALISKYGSGYTKTADISKIEVSRLLDSLDTSGRKIYIDGKKLDKDFNLINSDSVYISSYTEVRPIVFFEGSILTNQDDTTLTSSNKKAIAIEKNENYAYLIRRNKNMFTDSADLQNAYIRRGEKIIPINIEKVFFEPTYLFSETAQAYDILVVPFKQSFVTVAGAVRNPGRYPYIPDRSYEYYIGLAGGFVNMQNAHKAVHMVDKNNKKISKDDPITPECTITADSNAFIYYFTSYAPVITTTLTIITSFITVYTFIQNQD